MSALRDDSREAHEASYDEPFYDDPRDVDDEEEAYERGQQIYACTDRMCGALDCATCYPASFDAIEPAEEEPDNDES